MARTATRHLIVGWSRGGLGYVTRQLNHMKQDTGTTFDQHTTAANLEERLSRSKPYEVSAFVVPFLNHPAMRDIPVAFVLRDPMRVLNSLYFHGLFHTEKLSPVRQTAIRHLNKEMRALQGRPAQQAIAYLTEWFQMAQTLRPGLPTIRLENGPAAMMASLSLEFNRKLPVIAPDVNSSYCKQMILPGQLPQPAQAKMIRFLIQLGYREYTWMPRGGHAHYVNPDWHC